MTPQIGHMLYNLDNQVGMVTEVDYISLDQYYLVKVEWYIDGKFYDQLYRVGEDFGELHGKFLKNNDYATMRKRWEQEKEIA